MGTKVYWFLQAQTNVPDDSNWLSTAETETLSGMRFEKRRTEWRLGRWTAKRAIGMLLAGLGAVHRLNTIEIKAAEDGAPEAYVEGRRASLNLSISHREELALCSLCTHPSVVGCDLELIEPRSAGFVSDYFTPLERDFILQAESRDRAVWTNLIWSAKECALKAMREGLRLDTRSVEVSFASIENVEDWSPFIVKYKEGIRVFEGWWCRKGSYLVTMATDSFPSNPIQLSEQIYKYPN